MYTIITVYDDEPDDSYYNLSNQGTWRRHEGFATQYQSMLYED